MKVFKSFNNIENSLRNGVIALGTFDGVHLGHRALLHKLNLLSQQSGLLPAVLTFEPLPREFFSPQTAPVRLSTLREKLELFAAEGVGLSCAAHFNARLAALTAEEFIEQLLVRCLRVKRCRGRGYAPREHDGDQARQECLHESTGSRPRK